MKTQMYRERQAEIRMMHRCAKKCLRSTEPGGWGGRILAETSEGAWPWHHSDFKLWDSNFCGFKAHGL